MKSLLVAILCLTIPTCAFAADNGYKVIYDGGSLPGVKAGTTVKLYVEPTQVRIFDEKEKKDLVVIPASSITEVSYGQDVHRRVGTEIGLPAIYLCFGPLMLFSNAKTHSARTTA